MEILMAKPANQSARMSDLHVRRSTTTLLLTELCLITGIVAVPATPQRDTSELASWDATAATRASGNQDLLIRVDPDCNSDELARDLAHEGFTVVGSIPRLRVLRLRYTSQQDVGEALISARELSGVEIAEPDQVSFLTQEAAPPTPPDLPNDTYFNHQWHLRNTGQLGGVVGADIQAVKAWQIEPGSEQVRVAVLDTGIDYAHPELLG